MLGPTVVTRLRRTAGRGSVAVALVAGLVVGVAPTAQATSQLACTGGGAVTIDKQVDGTYTWVLSGVATCNNPEGDPVRTAALTGLATTPGLGYCSGDVLLDGFSMNVAVTFSSLSPTRGMITTLQHEVWSLPETTFPVATAFGVSDQSGPTLGMGEISTHIAGKCPPEGEPSMQVAWVQSV